MILPVMPHERTFIFTILLEDSSKSGCSISRRGQQINRTTFYSCASCPMERLLIDQQPNEGLSFGKDERDCKDFFRWLFSF